MDRFEELKKYKELMDEGVITEEDFNAKKKEFLAVPAMQSDEGKTGSKTGSEEISAAIKKISEGIKADETKKEIAGDFRMLKKEGVRGLRKLSAGTAVMIAAAVCLIIVVSLTMFSQHGQDSSYDSGGSSGSSGTEITEKDAETFVTYGVIKEIQSKQSSGSWNSEIDPYSCFIDVNSYLKDGDDIVAYGTCHLRDKYGNVVSKYYSGSDYSVNFEVRMSQYGVVESCSLN